MVYHYMSAAYKRKHEEQKLGRAEMGGGSHTQGSAPLAIIQQDKVRKCIRSLNLDHHVVPYFTNAFMYLCAIFYGTKR
jgi:hypothetical protein